MARRHCAGWNSPCWRYGALQPHQFMHTTVRQSRPVAARQRTGLQSAVASSSADRHRCLPGPNCAGMFWLFSADIGRWSATARTSKPSVGLFIRPGNVAACAGRRRCQSGGEGGAIQAGRERDRVVGYGWDVRVRGSAVASVHTIVRQFLSSDSVTFTHK